MTAEAHIVERGTRGDGQYDPCVVRLQRRHVAWQLGVARQRHIVGELYRKTVAVADHAI
jgi:hypothetical protein